jgi:hypothetical protein
MRLRTEEKITETENLEIQHGIFQEDSLSTLQYCIGLMPLTEQLNKLNTGYKEHTTYIKISHLLYTDNLKLIGKTQEELLKQVQVVRTFSDDIHMEFGFHSCAKIVLKRGKLVHSQNLILNFKREKQELEQGKT